jgi:hypothetical protein
MRNHPRNAGFFGVPHHMRHGPRCLRVVTSYGTGVGNEQHSFLVRYRCDGGHVCSVAGRKYMSRGRRRRNRNSALIHSSKLAGAYQRSHAHAAGRCRTRGSAPPSMIVLGLERLKFVQRSRPISSKRRDRARSASSDHAARGVAVACEQTNVGQKVRQKGRRDAGATGSNKPDSQSDEL